MRNCIIGLAFLSVVLVVNVHARAQTAPETPLGQEAPRNLPEREEWFSDLALGMFIHWSVDSQLGSVISHSLAGASDDYIERFFTELPATFEPKQFDPSDWARLAKVAGMRYVMFTAKHHSGFCMFDTETTDFSIMHTPFKRDITREIIEAYRREGIAVGLYFSPEDFWMLHQQGQVINRTPPYALPSNNEGLRDHNRRQLRELFTNYGPIDLAFLDSGDAADAVETIWNIKRDTVITRGVMETPEQKTPDTPLPPPWEACYTLGTQWQFKPTNEVYKTGTELIEKLIEIRAKGGNLLLNVGPEPSGVIPFEQERVIRELALWLFVNGEAIYAVRPWHIIREGDFWFTKAKDAQTLYAFLTRQHPWPRGERREFVLKSVRATDQTEVAVLGHGGKAVEYQPETDATPRWTQEEQGLRISVVRGQRIYNNGQWPNPIVVRLTHVEPVPTQP
ncbi:MAG: alpha-L-fucosidase [Candidatus Hydrogenedentes bacterium]|nr:alpha-L-fucosidase [Candidatus Hydrogenedentota bacterium]